VGPTRSGTSASIRQQATAAHDERSSTNPPSDSPHDDRISGRVAGACVPFADGSAAHFASGPAAGRTRYCNHYDGDRRRAGRIRSGSQPAARRRRRRLRKYLGRAGAARRRRCRRTQADDRADDRRPRTTTPRRLAIDSARIDPKRDLTDWLSARHYRGIRSARRRRVLQLKLRNPSIASVRNGERVSSALRWARPPPTQARE
jgi:hypothetical protein